MPDARVVFVLLMHCILHYISPANADCRIQIDGDKPILYRTLGTHSVTLDTNDNSYVEFYNGDEITAHCYTGFKEPTYSGTTRNFQCKRNQICTDITCYYSDILMKCNPLTWNLYETAHPFRWCEPPNVSYLLGRETPSFLMEYLAGACYNLNQMSIQSLYYAIAPTTISNYKYPTSLNGLKAASNLRHFRESMHSKSLRAYDEPQLQQWMEFANYTNHTLVSAGQFVDFNDLLQINWWPSLRLGNWRQYEKALASHLQRDAVVYDVFAGTSGSVYMPVQRTSCDVNNTLVEAVDPSKYNLPLFIWNYLSSPWNRSQEVVIIAVNSPFYNSYDEKDVFFCKDICSQLDWLQTVRSQFRHGPMGIMFCCSVEEVVLSKRLGGFSDPKTPPTTTPKPISTAIYNFWPLPTVAASGDHSIRDEDDELIAQYEPTETYNEYD